MTSAHPFRDLVTIGRVVKPQGRRGEIVVEPLSDRPDRFEQLTRIYVAGAGEEADERRVTSHWPHKGRVVLKLEGVDSIEEAERLRGSDVRIPEEELAVLPEGSYYYHQLRGLRVVDEAGAELGTIRDILKTGAGADVLVVEGDAGETLIPLVSHFVLRVDLDLGRLVAAVPELVDAAR